MKLCISRSLVLSKAFNYNLQSSRHHRSPEPPITIAARNHPLQSQAPASATPLRARVALPSDGVRSTTLRSSFSLLPVLLVLAPSPSLSISSSLVPFSLLFYSPFPFPSSSPYSPRPVPSASRSEQEIPSIIKTQYSMQLSPRPVMMQPSEQEGNATIGFANCDH